MNILARIYNLAQQIESKLSLRIKKRRIVEELKSYNKPFKIHLGCGKTRFDGWINLDAYEVTGITDIVWDLRYGIPVDDNSCKSLYSEHLLEHLPVEQGVALFKECYRVLQPGGVLRIAMPSLDVLIEKSYLGTWREQEWLTAPEFQFIQTRAEMLNISFRWWGHQWLYDREELHRRLREAGFTLITEPQWGESGMSELSARETRKDSLLIAEATK